MTTGFVKLCFGCGNGVCAICGKCHYCQHTKKCNSVPSVEPGSQKIKGLKALANSGLPLGAVLTIAQILNKDSVIDESAACSYWAGWPLFARPCPVRPRHGFVESRVVKGWGDVKKVLKETLAAEPDGEVMLTPLIDATYNAIWTPTLITVGKGRDGATAGKDVVSFPIFMPDGHLKKGYEAMFAGAGVGKDEAPYIEIVFAGSEEGGFSHTVTQLRAGTPLPPNCAADYLPTTVEVSEVVKTNGEDLLEWEKVTVGLEGKKGVVIWHPGGSMTDHYAVHARSRNIPLLTTTEPQVGMTLVPIEGDEVPEDVPGIVHIRVTANSKPDPMSVLEGVVAGNNANLSYNTSRSFVYFLLTSLHYSAVMGGEYGKWLGAAAAMMIRLGSVALTGEARHWSGSHLHGFSRQAAWDKAWERSLTFHHANLSRLAQVFRYGHWPSSGFGGKNWAMCAYSLAPIFTAISHIARDKSDAAVGELIRALNVSVNQAHNGGWWLNKFSDCAAMDHIQEGDLNYTFQAIPAMMLVEEARRALKGEEVERLVKRFARWPDTVIKSPKVEDIKMMFVPGIPGIQFQMKTKLLADDYKKVVVPFNKLGDMVLSQLGDVYLVPNKGGWKIEARPTGKEPITLWEEEEFKVVDRQVKGGQAQK